MNFLYVIIIVSILITVVHDIYMLEWPYSDGRLLCMNMTDLVFLAMHINKSANVLTFINLCTITHILIKLTRNAQEKRKCKK